MFLLDVIPKPNQEELKTIYISSCEMLKKFHAMFPPKNAENELKVGLDLLIIGIYFCFIMFTVFY